MPVRDQLRAIYLRLTLVQRIGVSAVSVAVAVGMVWLASDAREQGQSDRSEIGSSGDGNARVARDDLGARDQHAANQEATSDNHGGWAESWREANAGLGQFALGSQRADAKEMARAAQLSRLLMVLPDVEHADVVWDSETRVGWRQAPRVRATVYLKPADGRRVTPDVVDAVRRAVAGSKAHLDPRDVVVMDLTEMIAYGADAEDGQASPFAVEAAQLQRRIEHALGHLPDVRVTVAPKPRAAAESARPTPTYASTLGGPNQRLQLPSDSPDADESGMPSQIAVFVAVPAAVLRDRAKAIDDESATDGSEADARAALIAEVEAIVASATTSLGDHPAADVTVTFAPDAEIGDTADVAATSFALSPLQRRIAWFLGAGALLAAGLPSVLRKLRVGRQSQMAADSPQSAATRSAAASQEVFESVVRTRPLSDAGSDSPAPASSSKPASPPPSPVTSADIERLAGLSPKHLQAVYAEFPMEVWQTALVGVSPKLCAQLLAALPDAEATTLRRSLARQRPVRLRDVENAQARVAARAVQVSTAW